MISSFLEVKNIKKEYGNHPNKVHALKGVSFQAEKGSFTAITGKSGSGKTTLLKILGGLQLPTSGEVWIDGININKMDDEERTLYRRCHIGYIFQDYNLIPSLNVADNLVLPLQLNGDIPDKELFLELTHVLELEERLEAMPHMLSGGQQQRVAIARALLMKPQVIFADEPTGNLDTVSGEKVLSLLKKTVAGLHQTLLMITHDEGIADFADRRLHIEDGLLSAKE